MTAIAAPNEPACRQSIRITAITPKAEKAIKRLSHQHQLLVAEDMRQAIAFGRCKPVEALVRYRARRFDVSNTLRVTFGWVRGEVCVLHAGTHPQADRFADLYAGELPTNLIPLEESQIMKNLNSPRLNGVASSKPVAAKPAEETPAKPVAMVSSEAELLVQAIGLIADKAMEDKKKSIVGDIVAMGELVRSQTEENIKAQVRSLAAFQETQRKLLDEHAERNRKSQGSLTEDIARLRDRLSGDLKTYCEEHQTGQKAQAAESARAHENLLNRLGILQAANEQQGVEFTNAVRSVQDRLAQSELQLVDLSERNANLAAFTHERADSIQRIEKQILSDEHAWAEMLTEGRDREAALRDRVDCLETALTRSAERVETLQHSVEKLEHAQQVQYSTRRSVLSRFLKFVRLG